MPITSSLHGHSEDSSVRIEARHCAAASSASVVRSAPALQAIHPRRMRPHRLSQVRLHVAPGHSVLAPCALRAWWKFSVDGPSPKSSGTGRGESNGAGEAEWTVNRLARRAVSVGANQSRRLDHRPQTVHSHTVAAAGVRTRFAVPPLQNGFVRRQRSYFGEDNSLQHPSQAGVGVTACAALAASGSRPVATVCPRPGRQSTRTARGRVRAGPSGNSRHGLSNLRGRKLPLGGRTCASSPRSWGG